MNARALIGLGGGLIVCASAAGFVAGYNWPRNSVEDSAAKQLLSLNKKMSADVMAIQRVLARDATKCPSEFINTAEVTEGATPNKPETKSATESQGDTAQQRAQAEAIVTRGISAGRWTDSDVRELRAAMRGLSGEEMESLVTPLLQAINAQQVKLEAAHGVL